MKVVLDTNLLVALFTDRLDIFHRCESVLGEPCEFFVTQSGFGELQNMAAGKRKNAKAAKAALAIGGAKYKRLQTAGKADAALLALDPKEYVIATNDRELIGKLKAKHFRIVRQAVGRMRIA